MGLGAWRYDSLRPDLNDCCFMNFLRAHHWSWRPVLALAATLALARPFELEDRIFRIKTERSSASVPDTRTSHNISNIELLEQADGLCKVRFNWHTLSFRYKTVDSYFGCSFYTLDVRGDSPLIKAKKVILKNDYVRQVIDVYHL